MPLRRRSRHSAPRNKKRLAFVVVAVLVVLGAAFASLYQHGTVQLSNPSLSDYRVRGIDVSAFQRAIDWPTLVADSKIGFAFIKASEGSRLRDRRFQENWSGARGLVARGAYHFFTFCTGGDAQAKNFLGVLPTDAQLPPAVDVEFGGNCTSWTSMAAVRSQLRAFLTLVKSATHRTPILYVTSQSYGRIVRGYFDGYPLWIREVASQSPVNQFPNVAFWQYAGNGRLTGIKSLVDLDAFVGGRAQFEKLLRSD